MHKIKDTLKNIYVYIMRELRDKNPGIDRNFSFILKKAPLSISNLPALALHVVYYAFKFFL